MKILALIPSFYGPTGEAVNERQLITALSKKAEKVYVVTFIGLRQIFTKRRNEIKIPRFPNLKVILIPIPQIHPLIIYTAMLVISCILTILLIVLHLISKMKVDIIYIRNSFLSMGFLTFNFLSKRTVVKIHSIIEEEVQANKIIKLVIKKFVTILDRLALNKARRIAVHNLLFYKKLVKLRLAKHHDVPLEIPPGVDLHLMEKVKKVAKRKKDQNLINIGFVGTLTWWQGADILVQAVALLRTKYPAVKLYFIGDGELRTKIERECKALNIPCEITGFLPHEEALRYLGLLDIVVIPRKRTITTESTIPLKLIESWAIGVPVVMTAHEALKQKYKDGEDVLYVEPVPEDVARKIMVLLSSKDIREKLSKKGIINAKEFNYEIIVSKIIKSLNNYDE
ncbi:MAG: glycosyltransferase family 4 protein [Desulfurococcaceae archaeon]